MRTHQVVYTLALILFLQHSFAQTANTGKSFTIKGNLTGNQADSVFVHYLVDTDKYQMASAQVLNGKFILKGFITQPTGSNIFFKYKAATPAKEDYWQTNKEVFLDAGELLLTGDPANMPTLVLSGSKTEDEYHELEKQTDPIHEEMTQLGIVFDQYVKDKNKQEIAETHAKYQDCEDREKRVDYNFFLVHPNSYVTAYKMLYSMLYLTQTMGLDSIKKVYSGYNATLKESNYGKKLAGEIEKIESGMGAPGTMAANFTATDVNGHSLSLSDFKGKYVMVDFWASWCVPCRKGNPHMIELYNTYKNRGFNVISVSDDGNESAWKKAVLQDKIGIWHHIRTGQAGTPEDINGSYGVRTLPAKILIDPTGKIIGRYGDNLGGTDEDMDKMLASVFNK